MGCSIHLHIEIRHKNGREKWRPACFNEEFTVQNYAMFGALAGVREEYLQVVPLRGLPDDMCKYTEDYLYHPVIYKTEDWSYYSPTDITCVTHADALKYVKEFGCHWRDKDQKYVSDPDFHSHNWCTTQEMNECVETVVKKSDWGIGVDWHVLAKFMNFYEECGYECRAIYWFDS